jgi:hypothetical protein
MAVFFNIILVLSVVFHVWTVKKMESDNVPPRRLDYALIAIYALAGVFLFAGSDQEMSKNPVEGWTDMVLGAGLIGVAAWSATVYKRLR